MNIDDEQLQYSMNIEQSTRFIGLICSIFYYRSIIVLIIVRDSG